MAGAEYDVKFGIKADAKQAKKEIKDIVVQAQSVAKNIQSALEATRGSKKGTQLRQLRDEMGVTAKEVKEASNAFSLYQAVLGQTAAAERQLSEARNDADRKKLKKSLSSYTSKRNKLDPNKPEDAAKLEKYNTKIAEIQKALEPSNATIDKLTTKIAKLKERTASLKPIAKQFVDTYGDAGTKAQEILDIVNKTATSTGELSGKANKLNEGFDKAKTAANGVGTELEGLTTKENKANEAKAKRAAATAKEDTSIKGLISTLAKYQSQLDAAKKSGQETADIEQKIAATTDTLNKKFQFSSASDNIATVTRRLLEMQRTKRELETAGIPKQFEGQYEKLVISIEHAKQAIYDYKKNLKGVSSSHDQVAKSSKQLLSGIKKLLSPISRVKSEFKSLSGTLNKVKGSFNSMAHNMKSNFKHMLTSITKYVLGFRSLFFLVRRLRKYLGEGIQNLVQFNNGNNIVNESITDLLSSLLYLKNAWAAAFSPIITVVRPILVSLINSLAEVGNAVARFMSSLFVQEIAFNAVRVQAQDYADSLDNVGGSAGSAADKTKKLTDRLAAFDDLNVLGVDKDPDGTGSGGGGGLADAYVPDPNEMFKIVDPEKNGFLEALKEAWLNADFTSVGDIIKDKIISVMPTEEDWNKIKERAGAFGTGFGQFLTGLLGDPELFTTIGDTLANGFNTITTAISNFLTETEKIDFGGNLAEGINAFLGETDWLAAGDNINNVLTQITDNINSFANSLDADTVSSSIANFIAGINIPELLINATNTILNLGTVTWEITKETVDKLSSAIADQMQIYVQSDHIHILKDEEGNDLEINTKTSVDWSEHPLLAWLDQAVTDAGEAVVTIVFGVNTTSDLDAFTKKFENFLSVLANIVAIGNLVNEIFGVMGSGVVIKSLEDAGAIGPVISNLSTVILVIRTAFGDLSAAMELIIKLSPDLTTGFANLKRAIEIVGLALGNPISQFTEWKRLISGLSSDAEKTDKTAKFVKGSFKDMGDGIGLSWSDIQTKATEVTTYLTENLPVSIETLTSSIATKFETLKTSATTSWETMKTNITTAAETAKSSVETTVEEWKTNLATKWYDIRTAAVSSFWTMKSNIVEAFEAIKDGIKNVINNGIIPVVENMINYLIDGINGMVDKLNSLPDVKITNPLNGKEVNLGISLPTLGHVTIPRLAQGAVIPPNKEFMAVLGDQSHGTNIEAPLDTIKQAVAEVIGNNNNEEVVNLLQQLITVVENKNLTIGDKEIGKANARYNSQQRIIRGTSF